MSVLSGVVARGRAQAAARFTETFLFFTETEGVNPETLRPTVTESVVKTNVRGRLKHPSTEAREPVVAGQVPVVARPEVHVAVGDIAAAPNTLVRVLSSEVDAGLVGRVFRVVDGPEMGQVTAWRHPVEDTGRVD